jgi:hypothetical protein
VIPVALARRADAPDLARVKPMYALLLRSHSQFRPNCATGPAVRPASRRRRRGALERNGQGAAAKPRAASRVDMPQRAALESAFPLVLGAAQIKVPAAAFRPMETEGIGTENPQRLGAGVLGSAGGVARIEEAP